MYDALDAPVALVAHDAGAANHMLAWLENTDHRRLIPCLDGPALKSWRQQYGETPQISLVDAVAASRTLISGTGWASNLEHEARQIAHRLGVKSIAVIDHWINYRERFIRDGEEALPDEIWVTDAYARKMAETTFPNTIIVQQPNAYLAALVQEVERIEHSLERDDNDRLLYVLEPIRQGWGDLPLLGEFIALDYFIDNLDCLALRKGARMRLRPHPSDPDGKYNQWIRQNTDPRIVVDCSTTLAESLAWANVVVGCQTYAMVVALAAGRKVISSIPPWAPACILPHAEIIQLSALQV